MKTRKVILERLFAAEAKSGIRLIMPSELRAIRTLWEFDAKSRDYSEDAV
jgi:hypothetical protein